MLTTGKANILQPFARQAVFRGRRQTGGKPYRSIWAAPLIALS